MEQATQREAAKLLLDAYASRTPIAPLTQTYPTIEFDDSYAIQRFQVEQFVADGAVVKGHKVGLTSAVMQRQLGVDQPDYGHLFADMFHLEHDAIPVGTYLQPKIEPEIAFVLSQPLVGPGVTVAEAISAVDYVLPSLEIIDSRIADWKITIIDTIADNASSGGVVLGSRPTRMADADLRLVGCTLHRNGDVVATGAGGAVMGSPINSLVWLANTLGRLGVALEAGQVVLPGSVTAAMPVSPGDTYAADFGPLGSVTARFAKEN